MSECERDEHTLSEQQPSTLRLEVTLETLSVSSPILTVTLAHTAHPCPVATRLQQQLGCPPH